MKPYWSSIISEPYSRRMSNSLFLTGITLLLFGLAIIVYPVILAVMISSILMAVGITVLGFAWKLRKNNPKVHKIHIS